VDDDDVTEVFQNMDLDNDGRIQKEEFMAAFRRAHSYPLEGHT